MFLLLHPFMNNSRKKAIRVTHSIARKLSSAEDYVNHGDFPLDFMCDGLTDCANGD